MTKYCDFGKHYGCCSATDKNGNGFETHNIHKASYQVKGGKSHYHETFYVCKGCTPVIFGYEDYDDSIEVYDIKTGKDITNDIDFGH